jgi:hypothetical protein
MRFHRFDPYEADNVQKARERAKQMKEVREWHKRQKEDEGRRIKRVQFKRAITLRNKKITLPKITIALCLLLVMHPQPADAHCYSRWFYPTPQHCGGVYSRVGLKHDLVDRLIEPVPMPPDPIKRIDIPLPDMNGTWGGAMDSELELQLQRQKALRILRGE